MEDKKGIYPPGTVVLDKVSKSFKRRTVVKQSYSSVKSSVLSKLTGRSQDKANLIQALSELSVVVPKGSSLGVIGRNGSGKSTLLKLIAGIYRPDSGAVKVAGRISALIELGAGFHPDFTGRENIFLGGVMYGLSRKEIQSRFDEIVKFAELEDFIDDPVRTYSSGMYMRLGFSLAIHTDPDILLVDEVLAVGDAGFIHRCHDRISELKRQGKTLIFVTHDLDSVVRWCDEAIWLDKGIIARRGEPRWVIDQYLQKIEEAETKNLALENAEVNAEPETDSVPQVEPTAEELRRWGSRDVEITSVRMLGSDGQEKWLFHDTDEVVVEVGYSLKRRVEELVFGIGILRADGVPVHGTNTDIERVSVPLPGDNIETLVDGKFVTPPSGRYRFRIKRLGLVENSYYLDVAAHKSDGTPYDYHHLSYKFSVRSKFPYHGVFIPEHSWEFSPNYGQNIKEAVA